MEVLNHPATVLGHNQVLGVYHHLNLIEDVRDAELGAQFHQVNEEQVETKLVSFIPIDLPESLQQVGEHSSIKELQENFERFGSRDL